jgi:O-antigen/teichoic acid export membrane protein
MSRALGPHARGEVAFLITVSAITGLVAGLSVQESNANIGGSEPHLRPGLATNTLLLAALCGAAVTVVVGALGTIFPAVAGPVSRSLFLVALAASALTILKTSLSFLLQSDYAFNVTNLAWLIGPLVGATMNGALALAGKLSVNSAFAVWIGGQLLGVLILLAYIARHWGFGRPQLSLVRRAVGFGLKTHPGRLMGVGSYRADQWFVGSISGSAELGLYSVAVAWADVLFYIPGVLTLIQRPRLVRATPAEAGRQAAAMFRVAAMLSVAFAIGLFVAAPVLCKVFFGNAFAGSVPDLRVLALAALGVAAIDVLTNALTAQRMPLRATVALAIAFVLTMVLDIALIPPWGGIGAALATTVAYTIGGIAAAVIFSRSLAYPLRGLVPRTSEVRGLWNRAFGSPARSS